MIQPSLAPEMIYLLMAMGGLFALAGLWFIFRPKTEGSTAKIELFGMKFESSSAGVLVFLIGAAFLSVPLFVVPDNTTAQSRTSNSTAGAIEQPSSANENVVSGQAARNAEISFSSGGAVRLEGQEVEPNESIAGANVVPLGAVVSGSVGGDDTTDFFRIEVPQGMTDDVSITLTGTNKRLQIFDSFGEMLFNKVFGGTSSATFRGPDVEGGYVARVSGYRDPRDYQLTVAARPAE